MRIALTVAIALLLAAFGSAATGNGHGGGGRATLTLLKPQPVKVRGTRFLAGERVRITVSAQTRKTKRVIASARGSFVVTVEGVAVDRCQALTAFAVGNGGSRASLKLPQPLCPPRL
jgi:hypothetical protein